MSEEHQISITSELIDEIHKMKNSMEEATNFVYRCDNCKNILDSKGFCKICKYQYDTTISTCN